MQGLRHLGHRDRAEDQLATVGRQQWGMNSHSHGEGWVVGMARTRHSLSRQQKTVPGTQRTRPPILQEDRSAEPLLRGDAAVKVEGGARHKAGIVRGEKDDALGMSVAVPMRLIGMRFNVCWRAGSRSFVLILHARIAST
jgi:hypothetical protein